jgi:hypothetical protein
VIVTATIATAMTIPTSFTPSEPTRAALSSRSPYWARTLDVAARRDAERETPRNRDPNALATDLLPDRPSRPLRVNGTAEGVGTPVVHTLTQRVDAIKGA